MKYLHPVAFIPNELIADPALHFTSKRIAVVLLHLSGRRGRVISIPFRELAAIAGCSTATAQQAVKELLEGGYILKGNTYRYSASQGSVIKGANRYAWVRRHGGYTMVRKEILNYNLTPAAFCNLLYLYSCAGASGRAFPSLRRTAGRLKRAVSGIAMAKSTVCKALEALRRQQAMVRHFCRTLPGCLAANSYYLTDMVTSDGRESASTAGGPNFDTPNYINQITKGFTLRKEKSPAADETVWEHFRSVTAPLFDCWFDGTGVRVFAGDEQALLA